MNLQRTVRRKTSLSAAERKRIEKPRLDAVAEKLRVYDRDCDPKALSDALKWAHNRFESPKFHTVNDIFSDPLLIAEELVEYKADFETVLAAILYPAVRPRDRTGGLDNRGLDEIRDGLFPRHPELGERVVRLVQHTLQLRAMQLLDLKPGATQTREDHLNRYKLMCLVPDPRAILIRSVQAKCNLETFAGAASEMHRRDISAATEAAEHIVAPVAYIAGYAKLRQDILDLCYRVQDPTAFARTRRQIDTAGDKKVSDEDLAEAKRQIMSALIRMGIPEDMFEVRVRKKSAASAHAKAERKGKDIAQLNDLYGFMIILKADQDRKEDFNIDKLDGATREALMRNLGGECQKIYSELTKIFGRNNRRDPDFRAQFARLASEHPHPTKDGQDDRCDDYLRNPKPSGYSAIQDAYFIRIGGRLIEFEGQIVDEIRHDINTYGPRTGHAYYKAGLDDHVSVIEEWYSVASRVLRGEDAELSHTFVYDELHQIHDARTAEDLLKLAHPEENIRISVVRIDNDDAFAHRDPATSYSIHERLRRGDRVYPTLAA